ncbi:NRDE family protein [Microbacterium deminutum]|uniref:NRDE family protein n=1 Tax=Microbacterium deminutum TaxID=344164 RepID=A0ABP5CAV0_9MICO
MCTVIIHVGESASDPIRLLAIRDEDPARPWNPLGPWWPDTHEGVIGVRDVRAGGAWLAADPATHRLAVLLNRKDLADRPESEVVSRGSIVLASVAGDSPGEAPRTHGFNLVEVVPGSVRVTMWDGIQPRVEALAPGTHMIAHDDVDDQSTPRIAYWLDEFRRTPLGASASSPWWQPWMSILARSAELPPTDDRAIVRDNRPLGYPTLSTLICVASLSSSGLEVHYGEFEHPGQWNTLSLS